MYAFSPSTPMNRSPDAYEIVTAIRRIVRAVGLHSRRLGRDHGLKVPEILTLKAIADAPRGTTATAIRQIVQVSPGTLSGIVQRLVEAGYLSRERDPADRRRVVLQTTEAGRAVLSRAPAPLQERFMERVAALPASERDRILTTLERVVALMEAEQVDASPILTDETSLRE